MPTEGKPDYLALRVLDNNTGAEIVHELVHADATWGARALQAGMPGSSTLGTFTIHSPGPPSSDEMRRHWQDQWTQLAIGQRVEGYLGGVVAGTPAFSGIITGTTRSLDAPWQITGPDSMWLLQQSQVFTGETLTTAGTILGPGGAGGVHGADIVLGVLGMQEVVWDDDFSGGASGLATNYNSSGWSAGTDPLFGLPAITSTSVNPTDSFAVTKTTWTAAAQYQASATTIRGVIQAGTDTTDSGEASVYLLADSAAANGYLAQCRLVETGAGTNLWNVQVAIFTKSAGSYTAVAGPTTIYSNVPATFPFEFTAIFCRVPGTQAGSIVWAIRTMLNGQDCNVQYSGFTPITSGAIGVRFSAFTSGGAPQTWVNRITMHARNTAVGSGAIWGTARFTLSRNSHGRPFQQVVLGQSQTHLDLVQLAATYDNFAVRKDPGAGFKGDQIAYGGSAGLPITSNPSAGVDYSATIVLEEGINVDANGTEVLTIPEMFSSDVKVNAIPGSDTGGFITWGKLANIGDSVTLDTVSDVGMGGFGLMVLYAKQVAARKNNPAVAVKVRVIRDAMWLGVNGGVGPRELDIVTVYLPSLGVARQSAVIQGYDFVEGDATMLVYLVALPTGAAPGHAVGRLSRSVEFLGNTFAARPL